MHRNNVKNGRALKTGKRMLKNNETINKNYIKDGGVLNITK